MIIPPDDSLIHHVLKRPSELNDLMLVPQNKHSIRVLQVLPDVSLNYGGPTTSGMGLALALKHIPGISSSLVGVLRHGDRLSPNVDTDELRFTVLRSDRTRIIGGLGVARHLSSVLESIDVCIVHTVWNPVASAAAWACRRRRVPYILSPHGMLNRVCLARHSYRKRVYTKAVEYKTIAGAARMRFLNEHEANASGASWLSMPRSVIIPNGVTTEDISRETGFPEQMTNHRIVLYAGRLHGIKRLDLQAQAMTRVLRNRPDVLWVLIGPDDGEWEKVSALVKANGIEDKVKWLGPISGKRRLKMMQQAAVVLLTSDHEGQSMVVNEALSVGVPLVVTETVNAPEVGACGAGLVVSQTVNEIAQALEKILDSAADADMRKAGILYAAHALSWQIIANQFVDVFQQVLSSHTA